MPEHFFKGVNVDAESFKSSWKKLDPQTQKEAKKALGELLMCERLPDKLHFHKLNGFNDIWTIHVTSNDKYKASLTKKDGIAVMRRIGEHDWLDKNPE